MDPFGLRAWEIDPDIVVTQEIIDRIGECIAQKMVKYQKDGKADTDCADTALTALIECTAKEKIPLTLPVWNANKKKWVYFKSEDKVYIEIQSFIEDVTKNIGAIGLVDRDKITSAKELENLKPGDLLIYDLRHHNDPAYRGHTMVVIENDQGNKSLTVGEGHLSSPITKTTYTYKDVLSKWKGPYKAKGRNWNCKCFQKDWKK